MSPGVRPELDHPRHAARRVARNAFFLSVADIANKLMMFGFHLMAARHLGVEGFGVLSFVLSFVALFSVFTDFGLGSLATREVARDLTASSRLVASIPLIKAVASVFAAGVMIGMARIIGYPESTLRVLYAVAPFLLTSTVVLFLGNIFQGLERMQYTAVARVLQTGVLLAGAALLARGDPRPTGYAALYVLASFTAGICLAAIALRTRVRIGFGLEVRQWASTLKSALPFGIAAIFAAAYYWNGFTLLSKLAGDEAVGVYGASFRLVIGLCFPAYAFAGAVYPLLSRTHVAAPARVPDLVRRSLKYVVMAAVPLAVLGAVLARPVIALLYGQEYDASAGVLRVLVWWGAGIYINALLSNCFFAVDHAAVVTRQTAVSLGVNLVLNVALIPLLGALGAAFSIVAAELAGAVFLLVALRRTQVVVSVLGLVLSAARAFAAAVVAAVAGYFAVRCSALAGIVVALVVYIALLPVVRGIDREDMRLLRSMVRSDRTL